MLIEFFYKNKDINISKNLNRYIIIWLEDLKLMATDKKEKTYISKVYRNHAYTGLGLFIFGIILCLFHICLN
jgi:hypothetical protein